MKIAHLVGGVAVLVDCEQGYRFVDVNELGNQARRKRKSSTVGQLKGGDAFHMKR